MRNARSLTFYNGHFSIFILKKSQLFFFPDSLPTYWDFESVARGATIGLTLYLTKVLMVNCRGFTELEPVLLPGLEPTTFRTCTRTSSQGAGHLGRGPRGQPH